MLTRRKVLKTGATVAGATGAWLSTPKVFAGNPAHQFDRPFNPNGLVFPDTFVPSIIARPSPYAEPFVQPLFVMPEAGDVFEVAESELDPPPDPERHQRFNEFPPQRFYTEHIQQGRWVYHPDPPYNQGSWSIGWAVDNPGGPNFIVPGATYKAFYNEPVFVRRINENPPIGEGNVPFTLQSFTVHLHNAHTASESDGIPSDYFNPGEFWDHHYGNILAGITDERETMSTLWYHDHRLDFTATNVYAGISGMYMLFDDFDSNNENDTNPNASHLPSGEFDIPLILHDVQFDENGQVVWDFANPQLQEDEEGEIFGGFQHTTFGMLGDQYTINRVIRPYHDVKRRKYRFRILNGGPSRLYNLSFEREDAAGNHLGTITPTVISNDGNFLTRPLQMENVELWVANRTDVIIDFSEFNAGDRIYMVNHLGMRPTGEGPSGFFIETNAKDKMLQFRVQPGDVEDPSRIPDFFRNQPDIDFSEVRRERLFTFDYDNGLFTVNGRLMDPNRPDALIEQGSAEIWTLRNEGLSWGHPIHTHFEEFQIIEVNGKPVDPNTFDDARKDVVQLKPGDEIKFFGRWRDFLGRHVMHCHNVVHEDHAMMIRWDIVPPGQGD
ncbi:MAG: multicopper oxidase domain-containing protein [Halothiobacillus sp.]|nr:multicopper oxidase domain-containing protein [Halothiobacillus sp.]